MDTIQPTVTPEVAALFGEAAQWRLLGLLFEYPTDAWRMQLAALQSDLQDENLRGLADAALEFSTEGLHSALFGPAGTVPAREVAYLGGVQFGYLMAELSACYDAFGFQPSHAEAEDHLSVETGFVAYLKLKQAYALASGDLERAGIASEAASSFIKDHIALLAEPMLPKLENFAPDYLIGAGRILLELAGPSPRSGYPLGAAFDTEDDSGEMSCGPSAGTDELIHLEQLR
jgi:nitrate reductase assembly molybdenum cofactor insertion protein NarJ